ncbi:DUF2231 domain-containing protein [Microbacterium sp. XT11]|uniref:DUF2231 domain-containing protein n=1 Tax=Microbacterium sp. XT11 TaxID=367477 RepID=UPI000742E67F|nr:DUF2231 domain-containing protein [Microbacterium sp. XT11]ALX66629.1 hypothetical protein AB663_001918 [Microbacterium sp. XT11]
MDLFEIAGLPLHPLLVHAVVVLIPLTALALVLGALVPAARRRLGLVTPLAALIVLALLPVTMLAGDALASGLGPIPAVERHAALGRLLWPWVLGMFVVAAVQWVTHRSDRTPSRAARAVIAVAAVITAAGSTVMVVLVGEAGARAVWGA